LFSIVSQPFSERIFTFYSSYLLRTATQKNVHDLKLWSQQSRACFQSVSEWIPKVLKDIMRNKIKINMVENEENFW